MGETAARGGGKVAVIATGPSASQAAADRLRQAGIDAICVNDAWRLWPEARALYAADFQWWRHYLPAVRAGFAGELWSCDGSIGPIPDPRIQIVRHEKTGGLSKAQGIIRTGGPVGFSGAQALNLAYLWGYRKFVLLGFDMNPAGGHYFGDHPPSLKRETPWRQMVAGLADMARDLAAEGVQVINASPKSAIPYWPKVTVEEALQIL